LGAVRRRATAQACLIAALKQAKGEYAKLQ
jgi:hypothetical protein